MSNTTYPKGAEKILGGSIDFIGGAIKVALVSTGYTFSTAHEFVSDLGATRIATDQALVNKSVAGGVLDGDDLNYGAIAPGSTIKAIAVYKDTGNASTSPLLFYFDTVTGLPAATNGGVVTVPWSNEVKKIARINLPFYPKGAEKVWVGGINFAADALKVRLLPASYAYDASHEFLSDVSAGIGADQALANKTIAGGVFDADDAPFGALAAGSDIGAVLIYKDTGNPATSPLLILFTDTVGLPYTTNGANYTQQWSNAPAKIFRLIPA